MTNDAMRKAHTATLSGLNRTHDKPDPPRAPDWTDDPGDPMRDLAIRKEIEKVILPGGRDYLMAAIDACHTAPDKQTYVDRRDRVRFMLGLDLEPAPASANTKQYQPARGK